MRTTEQRNRDWMEAHLAGPAGRRARLLWIGGIERTPPDQLRAVADEVLIHANLANSLRADVNGLAVLEYAVLRRSVSHVVVCGHDDCDAVRCAPQNDVPPVVGAWLQSVRADLLPAGGEPRGRGSRPGWLARSCARNVARQVLNVGRSAVVASAWRGGCPLSVLGWILCARDGRLYAVDQAVSQADLGRIADRLDAPAPADVGRP